MSHDININELIGKLVDLELTDEQLKRMLKFTLSFPRPGDLLWAAPATDNMSRIVKKFDALGRLLDLVRAMAPETEDEAETAYFQGVIAKLEKLSIKADGADASVADETARQRKYEDFVVAVTSREQRVLSLRRTPPVRVKVDPLSVASANTFNRLHEEGLLVIDDIRAFGMHLFRILFGSETADEERTKMLRDFAARYQKAKDNDDTILRFFLQFAEAEDTRVLAEYPWELLNIPENAIRLEDETTWPAKPTFIFQDKDVTLVRTPRDLSNTRKVVLKPKPIKVLLVDARAENQRQDATLTSWTTDKRLEAITFKRLQQEATSGAIREGCRDMHVVHFIGHGVTAREDSLQLHLDEQLTYTAVSTSLKLGGVRLLILQAPPKQRATYAVLCRIASRLLSDDSNELQGVMAMQFEQGRSEDFAIELYASMLRGESIEVAIQNARGKLGQERGEFGSPVLLLRNWGTPIAGAPQAAAGATARTANTVSVRTEVDQ